MKKKKTIPVIGRKEVKEIVTTGIGEKEIRELLKRINKSYTDYGKLKAELIKKENQLFLLKKSRKT